MVYVIYSLERFLINLEIKKITKDEIVYYDLNNCKLSEIIDDINSCSLFTSNKTIVVDNSYIFTGSKGEEQDIDILDRYLENINPDSILIFIVNNDKLDERKKIVKKIKTKCKIIDLVNFNINSLVKSMFDKYNITSDLVDLLIDRVGNNLGILYQEINKIKTYKDDDLAITKNDILNLTVKNIDIDLFKLIEVIINKNKTKAIEIYNEMLKHNQEPIAIVITLANQIRIMYQAKELVKMGHSEKDIAQILDIHPYRVKKSLENGRIYTSEVLLTILEKLADLDYNIKIGKINKELGLELFILED